MIFSPRLPFVVSLICLLGIPIQAADLPPGGVRLVKPDNTAPAHIAVRHSNGKFGAHLVQKVDHAEFAESLRLTVTVQPPNTWDAGLSIRTTSAVKKGDLLLVGFWARGKSEAGGGVAELAFETAGAPYTKSVQYLVETPASGDWQTTQRRAHS
jgi:hypothetical protein